MGCACIRIPHGTHLFITEGVLPPWDARFLQGERVASSSFPFSGPCSPPNPGSRRPPHGPSGRTTGEGEELARRGKANRELRMESAKKARASSRRRALLVIEHRDVDATREGNTVDLSTNAGQAQIGS
jgi:hypothetical protein